MQQILLKFCIHVQYCSTKIPIFRIHEHCTIACKIDLYSSAISWKNSDLNFVFMRNFVQKNYLFRMNAQFRAKLVSYWYENYAKFCAKKSFRAKPRNCCARELTVTWKPYSYSSLHTGCLWKRFFLSTKRNILY